jgi:hypothetical protein
VSTIGELEARFREARAAVEAYSAQVTGKYAARFPRPEGETGPIDPALLVERARAWTDAERAELDRLRTIARELAVELHRARQQAEGLTSGD